MGVYLLMHVHQQLVNIYMKTKMQNVTYALLKFCVFGFNRTSIFFNTLIKYPVWKLALPRRGFVAGPGPKFLGEKGLRPWHVNSSALGCGVAI
jgi:hypothetical protein